MNPTFRQFVCYALLIIFGGCAGTQRGCASSCAEELGADWVVVQVDMRGRPFRCWELHDVSIANEHASDGIYWEDEHGNLVHISNFYNRVQVTGRNWEAAYATLGLAPGACAAIRAVRYAPAVAEPAAEPVAGRDAQ